MLKKSIKSLLLVLLIGAGSASFAGRYGKRVPFLERITNSYAVAGVSALVAIYAVVDFSKWWNGKDTMTGKLLRTANKVINPRVRFQEILDNFNSDNWLWNSFLDEKLKSIDGVKSEDNFSLILDILPKSALKEYNCVNKKFIPMDIVKTVVVDEQGIRNRLDKDSLGSVVFEMKKHLDILRDLILDLYKILGRKEKLSNLVQEILGNKVTSLDFTVKDSESEGPEGQCSIVVPNLFNVFSYTDQFASNTFNNINTSISVDSGSKLYNSDIPNTLTNMLYKHGRLKALIEVLSNDSITTIY